MSAQTQQPRQRRAPTVRSVVVRLSRKLRATYRIRLGRWLPRLLLALLAPYAAPSLALPDGMEVVSGQASASTPNAQSMVITQGSQKAILNWQSFNIGAGQSVQFVQPNSAAVALNRILGQNPTAIYGSLTANGQVFLINPAGVMFAPTAQVNVGGLVASSLALSNEDFSAGRYVFSGTGAGSVVNHGNLQAAPGGYVALLGAQVSNTGSITASAGSVALGAGSRITLDPSGSGLVKFSVDAAAVNAAAANSGVIVAEGGQVVMAASALDAALATVVNHSGVIRATSASERDGLIVLSGGANGVTRVSGTLDASGSAAGQQGGTIKVLGDTVALDSGARLDASGQAGGGTVLVGGNYQGRGPEQNATLTLVAPDAVIDASATGTGDGGKVVVWSDRATGFYGTVKASGGAQGGDGGFAEVSGKQSLAFEGAADLSAAQGQAGTLLLDPLNIVVSSAGAATYADVSTFAAQAGSTQTVSVATLNAVAGNITLQATNDITLSSAFAVTAGKSVAFEANNNININAALTTSGAGAINLKADADASGAGTLAVGAAVTAQAGGITLSGASITSTSAGTLVTTGAGNANAGNVQITASNAVNLVGAITANGGTASAGTAGRNAGSVSISGTTVSTGAITASGSAGSGAGQGGGAGGSISITGTAGVTTTALTASGGAGSTSNAAGGNAGSITVRNSGSGNLTTTTVTASSGNAVGTGAGGTAGSISIENTAGNITTGTVTTTGGTKGDGGSITLNAAGTLASGNIISSGGTSVSGNAGRNAGAVSLTGAGISLGAATITASGSAGLGTSQAGGNGAAVSLTSTNGITQTGAITASGGAGSTTAGAGGNAGSITVSNTTAGAVSLGALTASTGTAVGTGAGGTAGSISVTNAVAGQALSTGALSTAGGTAGNGGNITLSSQGAVTVSGTISTSGAALGTGSTAAGTNAGNLTITGVNRSITGGITASGGAALATGLGGGNAGNVSITGSGTLSTAGITASGGATAAAGQAGGNGGTLTLNATGGLTTTALAASGGAGTGTNSAGGNAGTISVRNNGSGNLTTGTLAAQTGAAAGTGAGGTAGSITVNNTGGNVTTSTITTTGGTSGDGGSVSVMADSGTLSVGAITSSGGAATGTANGRNAGSVTLSGAGVTLAATTSITANGSNGSTLGAGGNGGAVSVTSSGAINAAGAISAIGGNGAGGQPVGQGGAITLSASGGNVTLAGSVTTTNQAVAIDAGTGTYTQNNNVDVAAGTGAITVTADTVAIGTNTGNNALTTSGTLTLKTKTASRDMSLGGSAGFDLSAAEITAIATGATGPIVIGASASTGTLTIGSAVNLAGKSVTLNAGSISDSGVKTITASNLTLNAQGQIGSDGSNGIDVAVTNLSVNTSGNANAFVRSGAVNLGVGSSAGANVGSGTLELVATGNVTQTASTGNLTAGTLKVKTLSAGTANITLTNSGNDVATIDLKARNAGDTANAVGALQYGDANGFDVAALATTGNATLSAGAAVSQSGAVVANGLALTGSGGAYTLRHSGNTVSTLAANTGSVDYSQAGALTVGTVGVAGVTTTGSAKIETTGTSANLTLNNAVASSASGDAVVLKAGSSNAAGVATGGQLVNNVGASGIQASNGRYLVYSGDPASTLEGVSGYSKRYNSDASYQPATGSGNLFLYRVAPTLTISVSNTATNTQRVYGQANPTFSGTASGFIDGDTEASVGVTRSTSAVYNTPVGDVAVTAAATNKENYTLVLNHGAMKITPATISEVTGIRALNKPVDGNTSATLNTAGAVFNGIVAGDVLSVASASGRFDSPTVGADKTVYISGITLGGAASGNYILAKTTATTRASITDLSTANKQPLPTDTFAATTAVPLASVSTAGAPLVAIVRGGGGDWGVASTAATADRVETAAGLSFWPLSLFDLSALPATAAGMQRLLLPAGAGDNGDAGEELRKLPAQTP